MKAKNIVITEADYERLQWLITSARRSSSLNTEHLDALEEELGRATIVGDGAIPASVVTMNSRVRVKDLDNGREVIYQIVFPSDADIARNRISVLAPIGTGLLGYKSGTTVEWPVPAGKRRFRILAVEYQPEASAIAA